MTRPALRLPLAAAGFIALADTAIVALALPPILRELDTDVAGVAAVLGVYAVVLALALPFAERRASPARHARLRVVPACCYSRSGASSAGWRARSSSCSPPAGSRPWAGRPCS